MSAKDKNITVELTNVQQELFNQWQEFAESHKNVKVFEMFGEDYQEALNSNLKMQEELMNLWLKAINDVQPVENSIDFGVNCYSVWQDWFKTQIHFAKNVFDPLNIMPSMQVESISIDATEKFLNSWLEAINEAKKAVSDQKESTSSVSSLSSSKSAKSTSKSK